MDQETKERIADYFDAWELVELLKKYISTEDIIDAFEDVIEDKVSDIEDIMEFKHE